MGQRTKPKAEEPYVEAEDITVEDMFNSDKRLKDGNLLVVAKYYQRKDIVQQWKRFTKDNATFSTSMVSHEVTKALKRKARHEGRDYESVRLEYEAEDRNPGVRVRTSKPVSITCLSDISSLEDLAATDIYSKKRRGLPLAFHLKLWDLIKDINAADRTRRVKEAFGHDSIRIAATLIENTRSQVVKKDGSEWTMSDIPERTIKAPSTSSSPPNQDPTPTTVLAPTAVPALQQSQTAFIPGTSADRSNITIALHPPVQQQVTVVQHARASSMYPPITPRPALAGQNSNPSVPPGSSAHTIPFPRGPQAPYTTARPSVHKGLQQPSARPQTPAPPLAARLAPQSNFHVNKQIAQHQDQQHHEPVSSRSPGTPKGSSEVEISVPTPTPFGIPLTDYLTMQRQLLPYNAPYLPRVHARSLGHPPAQVIPGAPALQPIFQVRQHGVQSNGSNPHSVLRSFAKSTPAQPQTLPSSPRSGRQLKQSTAKRQHAVAFASGSSTTIKSHSEIATLPPQQLAQPHSNKKHVIFHEDTARIVSAVGPEAEETAGTVASVDPVEVVEQRLRSHQVLGRGKKCQGVRRFRNALRDPTKNIELDSLAFYCHGLYPDGSKDQAKALLNAQNDFEKFCRESFLQECPRRVLDDTAADIITEWLDDETINEQLLEYVTNGLQAHREELLASEE